MKNNFLMSESGIHMISFKTAIYKTSLKTISGSSNGKNPNLMYLSEVFLFQNFLDLYCSYLAHC